MSTGLFGQTIFDPINSRQLPLFHVPVASLPQTAADRQIARKFHAEDTPPIQFPYLPPKRRGGLQQQVIDSLDRRGVPYVRVDEAKKALFTTASALKSFHLVVYQKDGPHWLMFCGPLNAANRADMEEWERVFGEGFLPVFASERKGFIAVRNLAGIVIDRLS